MNYRHLWLENGASTLSMAIKVTCLRFTCRLLPTLSHAFVILWSTYVTLHYKSHSSVYLVLIDNKIVSKKLAKMLVRMHVPDRNL